MNREQRSAHIDFSGTSEQQPGNFNAPASVTRAAQGSMNNFTFGNDRYQYYETICGGAGTSAVQTHMTTSRLTDPEVLEWRFPVLLESFAINHGSVGKGRWRGDGTIRRMRFLEPMTAAILSNMRKHPPPGLGDDPGWCGQQWVERTGGTHESLESTDRTDRATGDVCNADTIRRRFWNGSVTAQSCCLRDTIWLVNHQDL